MRALQDDTGARSAHTSQFVISDAPLDLRLLDGGEWTNLLGVCALPLHKAAGKSGRAASIYQLNDLGDLFSQDIKATGRSSRYDAAVQPEYVPSIAGRQWLECLVATHACELTILYLACVWL